MKRPAATLVAEKASSELRLLQAGGVTHVVSFHSLDGIVPQARIPGPGARAEEP